jgi:hypothetical protein
MARQDIDVNSFSVGFYGMGNGWTLSVAYCSAKPSPCHFMIPIVAIWSLFEN